MTDGSVVGEGGRTRHLGVRGYSGLLMGDASSHNMSHFKCSGISGERPSNSNICRTDAKFVTPVWWLKCLGANAVKIVTLVSDGPTMKSVLGLGEMKHSLHIAFVRFCWC